MPILLDSNVLIHFFTKDSQYYNQAKEFIEKGGFINDAILSEVSNFIQNKVSASYALSTVKIILESSLTFQWIETTPQDRKKALKIMSKYCSTKLSFTDCLILTQAQKYNFSVCTWDQRMRVYPEVRFENNSH